jgi:hypothetical protein
MGLIHLQIEWSPWLGGYRTQIPILYALYPQLNVLNPPSEKKVPGYATASVLSFLYRLSKNPQISDFMIIRPDDELFIRLDRPADAWTYITQIIVALAVLQTREKVLLTEWGRILSQQQNDLNCRLVA